MRRRTTAAVAATTMLATGAATYAAGQWACAAALGVASRPPGFTGSRLTVHATAAGRVTLTRSLDSLRPGTYGIISAAGHAVIGPVLDVAGDPDTVVRRLMAAPAVPGGELVPGEAVALTPQLHVGDPRSALGIDHTDVEIPGERGPLPAWFVPGPRDTWVIALHGLGTTREHPMNLLPFLHRLRFPVLLPGYRGDPDAPRPRSRVSTLGAVEWHDADAAVRYAIRYGARRLVLYGWSSGGAMALYAASQSPLRGRVSGVILDSPVLDPAATVRALAGHRGVPGPLVPLAMGVARARLGPDADGGIGGAGQAAEHPAGRRAAPLPVLVLHGPGDTVAPFDASRELAARHPESVILHTIHEAEHAAMWNVDPAAYEETLRRFLTPLM
jgi:uncharacterized protein